MQRDIPDQPPPFYLLLPVCFLLLWGRLPVFVWPCRKPLEENKWTRNPLESKPLSYVLLCPRFCSICPVIMFLVINVSWHHFIQQNCFHNMPFLFLFYFYLFKLLYRCTKPQNHPENRTCVWKCNHEHELSNVVNSQFSYYAVFLLYAYQTSVTKNPN